MTHTRWNTVCRCPLPLAVLGLWCLVAANGCRSSSGSFSMDSNSRVPWFGLDLSLPQPSARRKTLETISDHNPAAARVSTAELRTTEREASSLSLVPRWLRGGNDAIPLPAEAIRTANEQPVVLDGPREEFR